MPPDELQGVSAVEQIGHAAGSVWHALASGGPQSLAKLVKGAAIPRDLVLQAIGWLAREDKLAIDDTKRGRIYRLR